MGQAVESLGRIEGDRKLVSLDTAQKPATLGQPQGATRLDCDGIQTNACSQNLAVWSNLSLSRIQTIN